MYITDPRHWYSQPKFVILKYIPHLPFPTLSCCFHNSPYKIFLQPTNLSRYLYNCFPGMQCSITSQMALLHMNFLKTANPGQQSWKSWMNLHAQNRKYGHYERSALFVYLQKDVYEALRECTYTNKKNCKPFHTMTR